jgi:hypothetical protein
MRSSLLRAALAFVALAAAWPAAAQNSDLRLLGTFAYDRKGSQVTLEAEEVCNRSPGGTSGTVYLGLWATAGASPVGQGYQVAQVRLSSTPSDPATLAAGQCFTDIQFGATWNDPPQGSWYVHFYVTEAPHQFGGSGGFRILSSGLFSTRLVVGNPPPQADDFGNTQANAAALTPGTPAAPSRTAGRLEQITDVDVFRFVVATRATVVLKTESSIDTVGELRNAAGAVVASDDDSGTDQNFLLTATLDPGTYYVHVSGYGSSVSGIYELVASISAAPGSGNQTPVAVFTVTPPSGTAPLSVTFDAFNSIDPDGTLTRFDWSFGDGTADATGLGTTHVYQAAGTYTAALTVTDNQGATHRSTAQIVVQGAPPPAASSSTEGGGGSADAWLLCVAGLALLSRLSSRSVALRRHRQAGVLLRAALPHEVSR